jgi:hypothetical protein
METCTLEKQKWEKGYTFVHVNQHVIAKGNKFRKAALDGEITKEEALEQIEDALTVKTNKRNDYGSVIVITHPITGEEVGRFEQTPFSPYSCGAQIMFKTKMNVTVEVSK